ncbi:MAG: ATP-dependent DNA helicase [Thiohalospira sp.]
MIDETTAGDATLPAEGETTGESGRAARILGPDGPMAESLPGFRPRAEQRAMADAVAGALERGEVLVAEAGTGTGKTFAYLVPALVGGGKVLISTGTRHLQDQLFHRDLPMVRKALGVPVDAALLKGRNNYLCPHRLQLARTAERIPKQRARLEKVDEWARRTDSGDLADFGELAEDDPLIPRITSTVDNCLGTECPSVNDCHLLHARRRAQQADLVVVNHHLLLADMALREDGFGELLPTADGVIVDEAHQLPDVATRFFSTRVSNHQLLELARDVGNAAITEADSRQELRDAAADLAEAVEGMMVVLGEQPGESRRPWEPVASEAGVGDAMARLEEALAALVAELELNAGRGKTLETAWNRALELTERLHVATAEDTPEEVHWVELAGRTAAFNATPLDVASSFRGHMARHGNAWVFTSATLAVAGRFDYFQSRLGLHDAETAIWSSPFDHRRQSLLYVPEGLPEPRDPGYTRALLDACRPVLVASGGRAFLLFTSHRALKEATEYLEGVLPWPLFVQGTAPRGQLLEAFRAAGNGVLLGTGSFWEGVDVRGEALSCVIIDKLPFAAPGDPVTEARIQALKRDGGNPFMTFQIPEAALTLKQGVGRLIRDVDDYGVLVIGDPRLVEKPYGRLFLDSLPSMTRTRRLERLGPFFAYHRGEVSSA